MEIRGKGVSFSRVCEIVAKVSADNYNGNVIVHPDAHPAGNGDYGFAGRLKVVSSRESGARRSWSGRRMPAACWHVYRDVLRAVFAEYPEAKAKTAMARYTAAGFENEYPRTANQNVGSQFQPAYMPDLCECEDYDKMTTYKWFVGWNMPGYLPDNPPAEFETEKEARDYLISEFRDMSREHRPDEVAQEFERLADEMEFHNADALAFGGDSYIDGPDGYVYFIECHDVSDA